MTDLQNPINPTNTPETATPTPVSGNNTGIDLSSTLGASTVPTTEVTTPVSPIPTQMNNATTVTPQATVVANPNLESNKPNQIDANKAKLMEALKAEWKKGKRAWFARWILSWILITLLIAVAGIIFAKDQVIDILSDERLDFLNLKASIVSLTNKENTNNNTDISNEEAVVEEEATPEEAVVEEEAAPEEAVVEEEATPEETVVEEEATTEEAVVENDSSVKWYTFRHVDSPEEANWVLSPNCEDALCGNDKDSIVMCNEFRLHESLSDDAKRTGSSWICRYKDTSELVFVEFN